MSNPLDEFAPWPRTPEEATADALARALTVQAHHLTANLPGLGVEPTAEEMAAWGDRIALRGNVFAAVFLLRSLLGAAPERADEVARDLWLSWHLSEAGWHVHDWLVGYGIDPSAVAQVELGDRQREAA